MNCMNLNRRYLTNDRDSSSVSVRTSPSPHQTGTCFPEKCQNLTTQHNLNVHVTTHHSNTDLTVQL